MVSNKRASREKVIDAAIELFNVQGYSGTSVRDIAKESGCNVALISYYFGSKQGLLEELITDFLEGYIAVIEKQLIIAEAEVELAHDCLLQAVWDVLLYQREKAQLARFVHREITLDTTLVRELMTTYLTKEKHLILRLFEKGRANKELAEGINDYFVLQLRGMLIMPFLHPQYIREVHHLMPHDLHFLDQYFSEIATWIGRYFQNDTKGHSTIANH